MLKTTAAMFGVNVQLVVQDQSEYVNFTNKIFVMQKIIEPIPDDDIVCFIDAYDVLINGQTDEILRKFLAHRSEIVLSAELNSYPEGYDHVYPATGSKTNYRYVNSGGYIGYKRALTKIFDWQNQEAIHQICSHGGDQHYFIQYYLSHANLENEHLSIKPYRHIRLDTEAAIFQSMFKTNWSEFDFIGGRVYNRAIKQQACFLHFNGASWKLEAKSEPYDNIMPVFVEKMMLTKMGGVVTDLAGWRRCTWPNGEVCNSI